ncbi:hypothetical protein J5N97_000366 [Dioscorea zingiberensis]|uniref:Heptahelical transmembrane protein 4-like n=1 Tax=Dioscorea zingiberensis TaxID=325984 RepID=A0A9D5H339_9LILI|nr:hypothetical protein J5N97_000366 [Dioscorea zingiberensis]
MSLKDEERMAEEAKYELVGFDSLPNYLKDNEFILSSYRSEWPWKQTILSLFSIHNETLNIWTHLIGFLFFLGLSACTAMIFPLWSHSQVLSNTNLLSLYESTARWPFYAYLFGVMFCLFTSSVCHLLSCHSEHCAYTMLRLDYTGISTLIVTSFYPLVYYTFMCDPFARNLYIGFITAFGVVTVLVSLVPVFQTPEFRSIRALLFFCMGVSGLVPILHKLMAFGHQPEAVITAVYEVVMGGFYGLGVVVYAARVPERWMPGRFDIVGHSHQIFHVLVIAGAYTHYLATLTYLNWREMEDEKIHRSCKEAKCKLIDYYSLPHYLKDNEFILDYYRCEWPLKQTILSIFSIHNETLNIWTHLVGFFIFLSLMLCASSMIPSVVTVIVEPSFSYRYQWHDHLASNQTSDACSLGFNTSCSSSNESVTRWPFFAFLCGAMLCLFTSSACHLLSCHSQCCSYIMLRLDYTGISVLIVTSFYPLAYYSFICYPFIRNTYIGFITSFGMAVALVSLLPVFQSSGFRPVRSALFFCMGVSGLVPIMHKVMMFSDQHPNAMVTTEYELLMGVFYIVGVVVYVGRVPERWMPGMFDLVGNSHQLFHLMVIAGAYTHYLASLVYLQWRDSEAC